MDDSTAVTFSYEKRRAIATGIIETANTTFLLLIAVRYFSAGPNAKAALAAANYWGLLLTPLTVYIVSLLQCSTSLAASKLYLIASGCLLAAAIFPSSDLFVLLSVIGLACTSTATPLNTKMYHDNYPSTQRGRMYSATTMIRIFVGGVFGLAAGELLSGRIEYFQLLLAAYAVALAYSAYCLRNCPTGALEGVGAGGFLRGFKYAARDRVFRITIICWMLMGFGNLMMMPLRVEYLADPRYGLGLSESMVALLVAVIPNLARLFLSPVWGHLFDRVNFFGLRVAVNLGFVVGIFTFFFSDTTTGLVLGAITYGVSNAGGDVAWSLWVTKFAPPERVADYMGVHTFFTGLRGIVAPLVSFHLVTQMSILTLGWISAGLILLSSVMLLPEMRSRGQATS